MEGSVTAVYEGREMRFCCSDCKEKFDEDAVAYFAPVVPEGGAARDSLGAGSGK
jgi:YHS domain-containing protein